MFIFKVWQGKDDLWYAKIVATNGKTLMHSQGYRRKQSAIHCCRVINPIIYIDVQEPT